MARLWAPQVRVWRQADLQLTNKAAAYRCRDGCGRLSRRQRDVDELVIRVIVERLRRLYVASLVARDRGDEV
jgi:hypothetical protein